MESLSKRKFVTSYGVALVYAGVGENDTALTWLGKAFDERSHWLVWLRLDPRWDNLRLDPRFSALVSRMKFPTRIAADDFQHDRLLLAVSTKSAKVRSSSARQAATGRSRPLERRRWPAALRASAVVRASMAASRYAAAIRLNRLDARDQP